MIGLLALTLTGTVLADEQGSNAPETKEENANDGSATSTTSESADDTPEIRFPKSTRNVPEAIRLAEANFSEDDEARPVLVSIEWHPANRFTQPESTGEKPWPESDTEWSWFLTYRYNGENQEFGERATVYRVYESGEVSSKEFNRPSSESLDDSESDTSTTKNEEEDLATRRSEVKNSVETWIHLLTEENSETGVDNANSGIRPQSRDDVSDQIPAVTHILRIRRDMLRLIVADIRDTEKSVERTKFLEEFLAKSTEFLAEFPQQKSVWLLRALVALELDRASEGWDAGRKVWEFFQDDIDDSKIREVFAKLERKGWLKEKQFEVARLGVEKWTNSIGMVFVPIQETGAMMSIWETRVRDFEAFEQSTQYDAGNRMYGLKGDQLTELAGNSWKNPGFPQSNTHPVVGVNGEDAMAFCEWLTEKERREGRIDGSHQYRLPRAEEWSRAAGGNVYVWGTQWPPPDKAGNFAGEEASDGDWPKNSSIIKGYRDAFSRTSPVGSFTANKQGLYDIGGNVWEWCENLYAATPTRRAQRGASWFNRAPEKLKISFLAAEPSSRRSAWVGFRCILELEEHSN